MTILDFLLSHTLRNVYATIVKYFSLLLRLFRIAEYNNNTVDAAIMDEGMNRGAQPARQAADGAPPNRHNNDDGDEEFDSDGSIFDELEGDHDGEEYDAGAPMIVDDDDDDDESSSDLDEDGGDEMDDLIDELSSMDDQSGSDSDESNCGSLYRDVLEERAEQAARLVNDFYGRNTVAAAAPQRQYAFQPLRLIRCRYKLVGRVFHYPGERSGHRIVADESNLYCLGGYNPLARSNLLFQELWSFNFASNKWKCIMKGKYEPNMPAELASNALIMHENVLISYGGTGYPFGELCSNECNVYTTGMKPIVSCLNVTGQLPTPQYGPAIVIHDHYLYTIGGTTGFDYSCDVFRMNLRTKVWEVLYICRPEMRDDPEGRYRHEVVYDGRHIFVLGGGTSHTVFGMERIPAFNLKTNTWDYCDTLPDRSVARELAGDGENGYPMARKCFSCVQHKLPNGDVEAFITGGLQSLLQADMTTYFSDVWKLNLRTKQWTLIRTAPLPKPLYFHAAAHNGLGCMYVFGGIEYSDKDMRRRNDLYKMWMTIPKLSEMCWEALNFYNPKLYRMGAGKLRQLGVPGRFVDRLPEGAAQQSY